jgi:tetratricopeptide (TPR) repeat protein
MLKNFICFLSFLILYQAKQAYASELDSLKQVVETMPDDSTKGAVLVNIALVLYSGEEAEVYAHRALALAKKLGIKSLIGRAYYAITWSHGYDEMDKKMAYFDSTAMIFDEIQDMDGLGLAYNVNAIMHLEYGDPATALISLQKAYDYFEKSNRKGRQAVILNNMGVCLNELNRPEEAIVNFKKALAYHMKEEPEEYVRIGRVHFAWGDALKALGEYDAATDHYLESYVFRKKGNNQAVAEALKGIALMVYEAAKKGQDTLAIMQKVKPYGFSTSFELLDSAENVDGVSERIEFLSAIKDVRRKGYLLYGNYEQAYHILEEQKKIEEDHKLSESSLEAFAKLKDQYEKEQLKTALLKEEVNNQVKENQVNLLLSSTVILLAVLIIGFLVYQNRLKANHLLLNEAKQEQQFVAIRAMLEGQEKERARIARDLHDGLGICFLPLK